MLSLKNVTIKRKLKLIILLVCAAAILIAEASSMIMSFFSYQQNLSDDLEGLASVIGQNASVALLFDIPGDVENILNSLENRRSIRTACVYDNTGALFAVYRQPGTSDAVPETLPLPEAAVAERRGGVFSVSVPIMVMQRRVGAVLLWDDMSTIRASLMRDAFIYAIIILAAILLAYLLSLPLQKLFTEPVMHLAETVRRVSSKRDFSVRALKKGDDEIGELTDSFNAMLEQIQNREMALRASEERFRAIAENSPDGIITSDVQGIMLYCNSAAERMFGYEKDEMVGVSILNLLPGPQRTEQEAALDRYRRGGQLAVEGSRVEALALRKDGREFSIEVSLFSWENEGEVFFASSCRDITERRRAEEERVRLATAIEQAAEGVAILDMDGSVVYVNSAMERIAGLRREDVLGKNPYSSGSGIREEFISLWDALRQGQTWSGLVSPKKADRITQSLEIAAKPLLGSDGVITGYVTVCNDVTDKKKLEEQLWQAQKMEAVGTLAGGIAHDFNNILTAIIGFTELSQGLAEGNSLLEQNLGQVLRAGNRAKSLVQQILAFSRKNEHELKPLQTHLIIKEALKLLRASIPTTIDLRYTIDDKADIVIADATQIHQIVMNLCTNAAHAMQESGGALEISLKPVDLDEPGASQYADIEPGPYLHLSVKDTGKGIPDDIIDRIFEPFFTTKSVGKGTGMGLSVVHGIVKSLHGDIKVYSEPGRGTVFHVLLPRVQEAVADGQAEAPELRRGTESVLLVDDEQLLLDVGSQTLASLGYRVTALQSPAEALDLFKSDAGAFDLVITDQTMPQLTGYELASQLLQARPDIPIVLCTGYSDQVTEESALSLGVGAFVVKPLNRQVLSETIRSLLDKKTVA